MGSEPIATEYGSVSGHFDCQKLSDLCIDKSGIQTGPFGSQLHKEDYVLDGTPIITVEHLAGNRISHENVPNVSDDDRDRLAKYHLATGDLVFSRVGSVDRNALVGPEEDGWLFSGRCLRVRVDKDRIDPRFLSHFFSLEGFKEHIRSVAVGATMPSINTKILSDVTIYAPPLPEQKAIAHILGTLDDKIELNRRMNATLEGMAQALFKSWFVDFDPVIDNALAAGNSIPDELAARAEVRRQALANGTANREAARPFPAVFHQTEELGWIPVGWEVQELGKLAQNIREGVDPRTLPHETPYVGLEHIDKHSFSLSRWGFANDVDSQKSHFKPEDFLFGKLRPYFHKVCHVNSDGICSTDILVIRPRLEEDAGYIGCQIFESEFVEYANLRSTGTRMPRASWKDMAKYTVGCPPRELRKAFNALVKPIRKKCAESIIGIQNLTTLRDTLVPKLISGELRVSKDKFQKPA